MPSSGYQSYLDIVFDRSYTVVMMSTENNTAVVSKCRKCQQEIKDGELVKTTWNGMDDEHIECPRVAAAMFAGRA